MKVRIFVATLAAASLLSFGAYAKPHSSSTKNSYNFTQIAAVVQIQNHSSGVQIGVVNQNSPTIVGGFGGYPAP